MKTPVFFLLTMLSVSLLFAQQEPNYQDGPELESVDEVEQTPAPESNPENNVQKPVLEDVQPQDDNVEETDSQLATRNSQLDVPEETEDDIKVVAPPSADNHPAVVPESIVPDDQAPKNDARNSQPATLHT